MSGYPRFSTALNFTSKRVRVNAKVNDYPAHNVMIDTAIDVPCIYVHFVQTHPTAQNTQIFAVPPGVINLSRADGSPLRILGYVRFQLTLEDITQPIETLVLPSLGPDITLLNNTIMGAFGGVLDSSTEQMSLKTSQVTINASHRRVDVTVHPGNTATAQCSVVTVNTGIESVPVLLRHKCCIPPQSAMAVQVESATAPTETTAALIESLIVTFEDTESSAVPEAFQNIIVGRTVSQWSAADKTAVVQTANPSHHYIYLKRNTLLRHIAPVSVAVNKTTSAVQTDSKTAESTRNEVRAALTRALDKTMFTPAECEQVLTLCTKYRSVFSLSPRELDRCALAEATFPLEPGTRPVNRTPYRANPRVQETIDKCVNQMEQDGIIEQRPSPWGSAITIVATSDGTPRCCVDYRST